jgi:hypothetical protein
VNVPARADEGFARLERIARDVPLASERALVELVSDLDVVAARNAARGRESFFGRLTGALTGRDRRTQVELTTALLGRQRSSEAWLRELARQGAVTDLALLHLAQHLRQVQQRVAYVERVAAQALTEVRELAGIVTELAREIDARLAEHDQRLDDHEDRIAVLERSLHRTQLWQAAWAGFDRSVRRWETGGAYRSLPAIYQVALLAYEVAAGRCGLHEFVTGEVSWRDRLVARVLADPATGTAHPGDLSLDALLDQAWRTVAERDRRTMIAELMGAGVPASLRITPGPLCSALASTMEYAARPAETRPPDPAAAAVEAALRHRGYLPTTYTAGALVRRLVTEQADAVQAALHALHPAPVADPQTVDGADAPT